MGWSVLNERDARAVCLIERNAQTIYISASYISENGKRRRNIIESRPEFAIVRLFRARRRLPIAWEMIYDAAMRHHWTLLSGIDVEVSPKILHGKRTWNGAEPFHYFRAGNERSAGSKQFIAIRLLECGWTGGNCWIVELYWAVDR
jgi:hypothetical protein